MNLDIKKHLALATIAFLMTTLAGCLAKEESAVATAASAEETQNQAPTITGTPQAAVNMGDAYTFTPTANDPDGDSLTFTAQNLPIWASFNSTTGQISGQPALGDVGVFSDIAISVSDGQNSASTPTFSITVSQVALGSMTLSWTPPVENTDGTALTDLAGYRIYYGESQGQYPNKVVIDTPGLASYVVENLIPKTYYVVATSVNALGVESSYSNVAVKTVQ